MVSITGTKGTKGKNGANATAGGDGGDATYTLNGTIGLDSTTIIVTGGDGGLGGAPTSGPGLNGGNGGNASATVNGNIFQPASSLFDLDVAATGGNGGVGGAGTPQGSGGNGGDATITLSGNIVQSANKLSSITIEAHAEGGLGGASSTMGDSGSASATLSGNIIQYNGATASNAFLVATAFGAAGDDPSFDGSSSWGTKTAILTGNVVQGNLNNVTLDADAESSNASASILGNIVQVNSTNTGTVTLEATGQTIDIEQNKITLGKQTFDLTVDELGNEYDATIKGNTFTGNGTTSTFVFTDNATPGPSPTPDTVVINLTAQTFVFDGENNKLKGFENVTVAGNNDPTIIGDNNANILIGGGGNDTFEGLGGNDVINGGGGVNTAIYQGAFAQYNLTFIHTGNLAGTVTDTVAGRDGTDTLQNVQFLNFSDGTYNVTTSVFTPTAGVNHAPAGTNGTVTTLEDNAYTFKVADFGFTDPNDTPPNNFLAVEIDTLPGNGILTDNGVAVTANQFVSVADITANKLVFTPTANANGTPLTTFTFQVEDDGGTAGGGQNLDQSPNTMTIDVTSVNDAPAGTNNTVTTLEDNAYTFKVSDFGFTDPNDNPPNNFLAVKITSLPVNGSLMDNGVAVALNQYVSVADITANKLVFTPAANANGAAYANFNFEVQDDGGTANGGQDTDQSPNTMTINVTSVNDAPAGTNNTVDTPLNTSYTFKVADFGFTDPNDNPPNNFLAVKITSLPTNGSLMDNGVAVALNQFVSVADITANKLVFTPALNVGGPTNFAFEVQDDGGTANGGQDTDQSPNTMTIDVGTVNHAPAGTNGTVTTLEDNAYTFKVADFGFTDPNDTPPNNFLAVEIDTLPGNGILTDNGVAVTANQFVSVADITANKLVFTPTANANGTPLTTFTFQVEDDGGTAGGGQNLDQSPNTMTIDVTSVNDAPAGTNNTVTTLEDNAYTFKVSDFGFTDPNDNPPNNFLAVKITSLPVNGSLMDNGVAVALNQYVSVADITANKLVFTPAANANGAAYANFNFEVQDDGGTANGGQDTDQSPNTMTINVTSVNDAPAGTNNTVTTLEDNAYTFKVSDFGFTDPNDNPPNNFLAVKITSLPANGSLMDNGVAVALNQYVSVADITANKLVFTPAANANGAAYANFNFEVQDDGGTANGGQDTDQSPNTMTINVTSVNDAPVGTNGTITTLEDNPYTFKVADFGFTDPNDNPPNNFLAVEIDTLPAAGAGTLMDNGVAVTANQFVSVADITANKLVFTPTANANGNPLGSFTFQVEDDGGTLNGGANLDPTPKTMTLDVTSVNDAPVGTSNTVTETENTPYVFKTSDFGFTDPNDNPPNNFLAVKITSLPINGSLMDNGVAVSLNQYVSVSDINAGNLQFTAANNASGNNYANFTFEVQDDGGTTNGGVDTDPNPKTMTVNVTQALVVGPGGFASINAAIAAANPGDTIIIDPGTYNENVVVNKAGITLQGEGPGVIIEGTFTQTNGNFAGPLATWLQTAPGYSGASGTGVTVTANNVTLNNITVDNFLTAVSVGGASVSGLTLEGVTMQNSVTGFAKPDDTALNGLTIDGSTFTDEYIGAGFYNDSGAAGGAGTGQDATNTTISNSTFSNIDAKGVYMETAQGNTNLTGLTMTDVGQYGGVPSFGADGKNGNGIDINLKYHTYTGNLTISGFDLTNVGTSDGGATPTPTGPSNESGAIVVEGRDDPSSYNTIPADVSGLNVTVENGTISGTSIGVRSGEIKANPSQNDTGPAVTVNNVTITGATISQIDNQTDSLMTVTGSTGDDVLESAQFPGSTGDLVINGLAGNDTLEGGLGDDTLNGGPGNDTLIASPGDDVLNGGGGTDTADFSQATNGVNVSTAIAGLQTLGDFGEVTLVSIENLTGSNYADVLTGDAGNNTLMGGGGNDTLVASAGKDLLDGGTGTNTADFSAFSGGVTVNLNAAGYQNFDGAAGDQTKLVNIQNLIGGAGNDILKGNASNNVLIGGAGDDVLTGGGGTLDIYEGGAGNNTITGTNGSTTDVAYYAGLSTAYTITGSLGGVGVTIVGPNDNDTLNRVDRLKFLSPTHVSDLDDNGSGDLVFQNSAGTITTVTNPSGTMSSLTGSPAPNWSVIGTGEFNPDAAGLTARKSSILLQNTAVGPGNGDMEIVTSISGVSSTTVPLSSSTGTFAGFTAITAGDFNGDAASDILLWNGTTQTAEIAFLNENVGETVGTVDAITTVTGGPTGGNWAPVASGDFNGDGNSDILWQNGVGGAVQVSLMNGATVTNTDTVALNTAPGFKAVGTGDFDGDGKSDILFATGGPGSAAEIWTMNGDSVTNTVDIAAPTAGASGPGTFTLMGAEDVNGDGFSDLLWQNAANGDVVATEMTAGANVLATVNLGSPGNGFRLMASTGGG